MDTEKQKQRRRSQHQQLTSTKWLETVIKKSAGLDIDLYKEEYIPIHDFMLIWNIFERDVLRAISGNQNINYLKFAQNYIPLESDVNSFFDFLRDRYTNPHSGNILFEHLLLDTKCKKKIKDILCQESPIEEKNQACLAISYRYRNNLFHGNKEIAVIFKQVKLFEKANDYLISYIDKYQCQNNPI